MSDSPNDREGYFKKIEAALFEQKEQLERLQRSLASARQSIDQALAALDHDAPGQAKQVLLAELALLYELRR